MPPLTAPVLIQAMRWAHRSLWVDATIYFFLLVTFLMATLVPFDLIAWDGYQFISVFTKFTAQIEWPDPSNTFRDVNSAIDFWSWWRGPFRCVSGPGSCALQSRSTSGAGGAAPSGAFPRPALRNAVAIHFWS